MQEVDVSPPRPRTLCRSPKREPSDTPGSDLSSQPALSPAAAAPSPPRFQPEPARGPDGLTQLQMARLAQLLLAQQQSRLLAAAASAADKLPLHHTLLQLHAPQLLGQLGGPEPVGFGLPGPPRLPQPAWHGDEQLLGPQLALAMAEAPSSSCAAR